VVRERGRKTKTKAFGPSQSLTEAGGFRLKFQIKGGGVVQGCWEEQEGSRRPNPVGGKNFLRDPESLWPCARGPGKKESPARKKGNRRGRLEKITVLRTVRSIGCVSSRAKSAKQERRLHWKPRRREHREQTQRNRPQSSELVELVRIKGDRGERKERESREQGRALCKEGKSKIRKARARYVIAGLP